MQGRVFIAGASERGVFEEAADTLAASGQIVANEYTTDDSPEQLKAEIAQLSKSSSLYLLSDWQLIDKAILEREIALALHYPVEYEKEPKHTEAKEAIRVAMGVTFRDLVRDNRNRWHVYARMIYVHYCKKAGDNTKQIAEETHHDDSTIGYYLRHYDSEYKYNHEFRKAAEKVGTLLSKKLRTEQAVTKPNE